MGDKKSIAYLSYDGLTDPLGQSQILPYVIGLAQFGYDITVFSFEKENRGAVRGEINTLIKNISISWVPLTYHKNPPVISTLFDLWILRREFEKQHQQKKFQLVHCRSYLTALIGLRAKKKYGIKCLFDMRGFWPDERVEGGLWSLRNPVYKLIYKFFKKKEKQFLTDADHVISLTENAKREIQSWPIRSASITVIPTCADLNLFDPVKVSDASLNQLRKKLGLRSDEFVLLYLGSWGTWYLVDAMLEFFKQLKLHRPNARFLIVTADQVILPNELASDCIITKASRMDVPTHIKLANASEAFIKPSFSKKASSATKIAEILAMGVPVLTNAGWGDADLMESAGAVLIENTNADTLNKGVSKLLRQIPKKQSENTGLQELSLQTGIARYVTVYQQLGV
jgi:glycosyltransferase involved in cell wall biosynthesis